VPPARSAAAARSANATASLFAAGTGHPATPMARYTPSTSRVTAGQA
jgi:hypothetical protein